jgi:hypothetical protein
MSDKEVAEMHLSKKGRLCGIYTEKQLRPIKPKKTAKSLKTLYVGLIGLFTSINAYGQQDGDSQIKLEQATTPDKDTSSHQNTTSSTSQQQAYQDTLIISGLVRSEKYREPLIGATVYILGTKIGTITNFNGMFQLSLPSSDLEDQGAITLDVSCVGYESKLVKFSKDTLITEGSLHLNVKLADNYEVIDFVVIAPSAYPLHKRVWWKIRGWFSKKH